MSRAEDERLLAAVEEFCRGGTLGEVAKKWDVDVADLLIAWMESVYG